MQARVLRFGMLEHINQPVWVFDVELQRVHWANPAALEVWRAKSLQELCERDMGVDMSESVATRLAQYHHDFVTQEAVFNEQWTLYPAGVPVSLHMRLSGVRLTDGRMGMLCHGKPSGNETPESLRSVEALLHTPVMITLYSMAGEPLYRNPAARSSAKFGGQTLAERMVEPLGYTRLMAALQSDSLATFTLAVQTSQGEQWHELSARRCKDAVTGEDAMLVSEADVSALKRTEARANFLALHDGLTGLPNRAHVMECFAAAVETVRQVGCEAALIFIDLDNFKDVNDTLGHAAGDALLVEVARRLKNATSSTDLVARLGGDEFLILAAADDIVQEVERLRARVLSHVGEPTVLLGTEVRVTPTMGVSIFPRDGTDLETLLRKADLAMYSGKQRGRNDLAYYHEDLGAAVSARTALETDLRHAFERNEFEVHYQPMVSTECGRVQAVEALVRWRHPLHGLLAPDRFIAVCESTGMILDLGKLVFEAAVQQQTAWQRQGHTLKVHINLSPRQFDCPLVVSSMQSVLLAHGCDASNIGVEITESMLLGRDGLSSRVLQGISDLGISIALDDFGTGYSNLAYLQRYHIDVLKIDKSFIQSSDEERPIADLIVAMCRTLGMAVVAEGVESQAQLDWVKHRGIEQYQGYLFSKPLPANAIDALLAA
ncbi:EAL domain-containing protein [Rhodoferax aquaticus]|uniref:EAL domain-containing protein n=2 Tax=Rhodoferax aquaticus TaxID=2527691 RepID=A0A515EVF3_9BURK|nr:EAL domain-containing protein [Rhodoferax aquaticus]